MAKVALAAGVLLLGLAASGAQAAITVYSGDANEAAWEAAAGGGPFVTETFDTDVANPPNTSASVAWGTITFGTDPASLGNISSGAYHDRANTDFPGQPLLEFDGLGARAFGAEWDLGPNDPGTGIRFLVTFVDTTTELVLTEIPNSFAGNFFGIVSDMAIRSIELLEGTQGGNFETFTMDNARVAPVPIPAALPLFLSALAALGFLGRRKKQLATA